MAKIWMNKGCWQLMQVKPILKSFCCQTNVLDMLWIHPIKMIFTVT